MAKKFSDDELDEVLSKIKKFDTDGIRFVHLKNSVKKNFIMIKAILPMFYAKIVNTRMKFKLHILKL